MQIKNGFTLIELMIVVAIVSFLAAISIPTFSKMIAKTKRTEAHMNLHALYAAEKAYWAEHGSYTTQLNGPDGIGWTPEGYHGGGKDEQFNYTYGFFDGPEGQTHFTGKLETSPSFLSGSNAGQQEFIAYAAGDIDGDGKPDIITINQNNKITVLQDDLQD
jgi:prepilin-type N-terminal cleavage/methylation domain-containing protein